MYTTSISAARWATPSDKISAPSLINARMHLSTISSSVMSLLVKPFSEDIFSYVASFSGAGLGARHPSE